MVRRRSKPPASKPLPAEKGPRSAESPRSAGSPLVSGDDLRDLDRALRLEWFEPDGAGGFAMSSVLGCPTRRQHGLLVIRPQGLERRHVLVHSLAERVELEDDALDVDSCLRDGRFESKGHLALDGFALEPWPTWHFTGAGLRLQRELFCEHGRTWVRWTLLPTSERTRVTLSIAPRMAPRDADRTSIENDSLDPTVHVSSRGIRVRPYAGLPELHFSTATPFEARIAPAWTSGYDYSIDRERGYHGADDLWSPGELRLELTVERPAVLALGVDALEGDVDEALGRALEARSQPGRTGDSTLERLERAGRRFLYSDGDRRGVIAGYPWLAEWGRDTFIALPGLTLAHGDLDTCVDVLEGAVERMSDGLIPNHFGADPLSDHYGAADTSLWFARCVRLYGRAGGSRECYAERLMPALDEIARAFVNGTELGLHVDAGGLLHVGSVALAATWMDAQTDGEPCTPRNGYPVEIQALWYALLGELEEWHLEHGERREAEEWADLRRRAAATFLERFWDEERGVLADVWRADDVDRSIRPNMIIAAALERSPLPLAARRRIVECVERELLTPRGLRTLSPDDVDYVGRLSKSPEERDRCRHQGAAWPWLTGFLAEARLRAFGDEPSGLQRIESVLQGLAGELDHDCLGALCELYEGDAPHQAAETPAMAKSVAEVSRALRLIEEVRA